MMRPTLVPLFLTALSFLSCASHTDGKVYGFAFKDETVTIVDKDRVLLHYKVIGSTDSIGVCSINEDLKIPADDHGATLKVTVLSKDRTVWDTVVTIPRDNKEPYLSLLYPSGAIPRGRGLFIGDASKNLKY